jgi:hypothetical protein
VHCHVINVKHMSVLYPSSIMPTYVLLVSACVLELLYITCVSGVLKCSAGTVLGRPSIVPVLMPHQL